MSLNILDLQRRVASNWRLAILLVPPPTWLATTCGAFNLRQSLALIDHLGEAIRASRLKFFCAHQDKIQPILHWGLYSSEAAGTF